MRGKASVPIRLTRMEQQRQWIDVEAEIQALAEEYGLHPAEVRREAEELARHRARYGPEPIDVTIQRLAAEYGLEEVDLLAEYERLQARRDVS
jgi:hypothetical protein